MPNLRRRNPRYTYRKVRSNLGRTFTMETRAGVDRKLYTFPKGFEVVGRNRITREFTKSGWRDCNYVV